jgi:hypothetical protein
MTALVEEQEFKLGEALFAADDDAVLDDEKELDDDAGLGDDVLGDLELDDDETPDLADLTEFSDE